MSSAGRRWGPRLAALLFWAVCAWPAAGGEVAYEKSLFDRALAQRLPVIVAFVAEWCATCTVQEPIVSELLRDPKFSHLTVFVADFDKDVELKKRLRVVQQSTLVVFKGGQEVARATGQTRRESLAALFAKAL
ncbi:thioredoxin family protein [uncultured Piscinibacter sp.]|uniref:thioredoxin family protein n=1 Tax=uncultured Piscinibacter sp. TaxID=1131835 RepID=UPI002610F7EC|nr:thioredoxin family protein [uncultured Piscinibacter sp.]